MNRSRPPEVPLQVAGGRRPRLAPLLAAAVLVVFSLLSASADASSAGAPSATPTIVLVHGAWADGSSWNPVTQRLQRQGYTVLVPPNPLRSLSGGRIDNVLPPAQQRAMAERAGCSTVEVRVGHLPMLSRPDLVTNLITKAARSLH